MIKVFNFSLTEPKPLNNNTMKINFGTLKRHLLYDQQFQPVHLRNVFTVNAHPASLGFQSKLKYENKQWISVIFMHCIRRWRVSGCSSMCLLGQMFVLFYRLERSCGQNAERSCMNHLKHGLHFWVWVHTVTWRHNLYAEELPTNTPASVNKGKRKYNAVTQTKMHFILAASGTPRILGCTVSTIADEYWAGQSLVSIVTSVLQSLECVVSSPPHGAGPLLKHLMHDGEQHSSSVIYI